MTKSFQELAHEKEEIDEALSFLRKKGYSIVVNEKSLTEAAYNNIIEKLVQRRAVINEIFARMRKNHLRETELGKIEKFVKLAEKLNAQ